MNIKKFVPWNWFRDEEQAEPSNVPVVRSDNTTHPLMELHQEFDRVFDNFWKQLGMPAMNMPGMMTPSLEGAMLKPNLDISASDDAYSIMVEVPGIDEDDVRLELVDNRLMIEGEKSREESTRDKNFYRSERTFGAFRRVLTLPDDADADGIEAKFDKGLLSITIPRRAVAEHTGKLIDIKSAA